MGPKPLWKRAAALLAAVGMSIFLAGGISADDENAEAGAARVLKPTQAIADIPQEYNELFEIQWGGGSLYHLKARLATMGCMLNTIWAYDNNRWFSYNQYNVPHSLNQAFLTQFKDGIPVTSLYGRCIDICTFDTVYGVVIDGRECTTPEEIIKHLSLPSSQLASEKAGKLTIESDTTCNYDFDTLVKEKVFSLLPVLPNTCIIQQTTLKTPNVQGSIGQDYDTGSVLYVIVWSNPSLFKSEEAQEAFRVYKLGTEIHELCHIQQEYYVAQQFIAYRWNQYSADWHLTEAYEEFVNLTGFQYIQQEDRSYYELPENSIYKNIYSISPIELSAELCKLYILEKIEEKHNRYSLRSWGYEDELEEGGSGYRIMKKDFDSSLYLTAQIVQWLETYMVLPYPNAE